MENKKETVMVDYPLPNMYYAEDTEWIIEPDEHDPGVLGAKVGARPVTEEKNDNT